MRRRDGAYEVLFPWLVRKAVIETDQNINEAARLDESAEIRDGKLFLKGREIPEPPLRSMKSLNKKLRVSADLSSSEVSEAISRQARAAEKIGERIG